MWNYQDLLGNICKNWGNREGPSSSGGGWRRFGLTPYKWIDVITNQWWESKGLTSGVSESECNPARNPDAPGGRGQPGVLEACSQQEEVKGRQVLQGVLVRTLQNHKSSQKMENQININDLTWMQLKTLSPPFSVLYMRGYLTSCTLRALPTRIACHVTIITEKKGVLFNGGELSLTKIQRS
jgi:hypothetical protein